MNDELNKKIIKDFGLGNVNPQDQERMVEKIGNLLFELVVERAVNVMEDDTMSDFENTIINAGNDYQKVISFLKNRVPDFSGIVKEELSRLKRATSNIFA